MKNQNVSKTHHAVRACLLFFLFTVLGHGAVMAQHPLVATLTHSGTTTAFMGTDALSAAHEAAEPGDVITLSPGTFTGITVTKGVTIRGAGDNTLSSDSLTQTTLTIDVDSTAGELHVEGVNFSSPVLINRMFNGGFSVCGMPSISYSSEESVYNGVMFDRCKIWGVLYSGMEESYLAPNSSILLANCALGNIHCANETNSILTCINCFIYGPYRDIHCSSFHNCLFLYSTTADYGQLPADNYLSYSVGSETNLSYHNYGNNVVGTIQNEIYKDHPDRILVITDNMYLTDEAAATYLGDDGTQVGMYGGANPYSKQLSYPVITRCEVGNRTNEDGTLTVNIEVSQ